MKIPRYQTSHWKMNVTSWRPVCPKIGIQCMLPPREVSQGETRTRLEKLEGQGPKGGWWTAVSQEGMMPFWALNQPPELPVTVRKLVGYTGPDYFPSR